MASDNASPIKCRWCDQSYDSVVFNSVTTELHDGWELLQAHVMAEHPEEWEKVEAAKLGQPEYTEEERWALTAAIHVHCTCPIQNNVRTKDCPTHKLILDQRIVRRLVFERRDVERLLREEFFLSAA